MAIFVCNAINIKESSSATTTPNYRSYRTAYTRCNTYNPIRCYTSRRQMLSKNIPHHIRALRANPLTINKIVMLLFSLFVFVQIYVVCEHGWRCVCCYWHAIIFFFVLNLNCYLGKLNCNRHC